MTITPESLRPGLRKFAQQQAPKMKRLQRALEIVYRDRHGGRPVEEIAEILLLAVARAHETRTQAALDRVTQAARKILDDVQATRTPGQLPKIRDRALRDADLQAIRWAATEDLMTFENAVKRRIAAHDDEFGLIIEEALNSSGTAPVGAFNKARGRGREIDGQARDVIAAWTSGHTLPERGVRFDVPDPTEPRLKEAMRRLEDAIDAYRKNPGADAEAAATAADRLQQAYSTANERLRQAAGDFDVVTTGDVLPGRKRPPGAPQPVGAAAEVSARADAVRDELATKPALAALPAAQLFDLLRISDLTTVAVGSLREPVQRAGLEKALIPSAKIRTLTTAPPELAARLAKLVDGWERAHLIGPGFGTELVEGMMLAPEGVNQLVQNKGFENMLRRLHKTGADVPLTARNNGRRLVVPLADGSSEIVDILESVQYTVKRGDGTPVVLDITVKPDGSWSADHHGTLTDVWPADIPLSGTR
ncbi:polymorphic toxin type 4 domain-containing protein [Streptomyces sp. NPDC001260]|uniref:polymorphic toxin type 4 domain-containing protein n=1 Tax=Streptomyces sp. NPDC001260 TaxID=3364551 RepID=UPI0036D1068A